MRRKYVLSLGLVGVLSGSAFGQFAADRVPLPTPQPPGVAPTAPPALPPGVRPIGGAYVPPPGAPVPANPFAPAAGPAPAVNEPPAQPPPRDTTINSALPADHPWLLKPEHGAYFICVKSYSRPARPQPGDEGLTARELAEALAGDIRQLYRVQAFLYEYIAPERRAEMAAIAAARERGKLFADQVAKYQQESQLRGMDFLAPDNRIRFKTVNYRDQIAVFVGGFQSEDDARKALEKVRTWPSPKNKNLMDGAVIIHPGKEGRDGKESKPLMEEGHLNPYLTAHVVSNPWAPKASQPVEKMDPIIPKLNEGRPYNLLKAKKPWTLGVKSFTAPVSIVNKDTETSGGGFMAKIGASKGGDVLNAGAEQAESLARALRAMKGRGGELLGLEAFVLHTRSASIVTVGQFDGPNDPALLQTKQLLTNLGLRVTEDSTGLRPVTNAPSLFGNMLPIPVPKM